MNSRQTGRFKRTVAVALAALFAAAVPATALAGDGDGSQPGDDTHAASAAPAAAAHKGKHAKKHAHKDAKETKAASKPASPAPEKDPKAKSQKPPTLSAAAPKVAAKKTKKTASRAAGAKKKTASTKTKSDAKAPPAHRTKAKPCFGPSVSLDRGGLEAETMSLLTCAGAPVADSRERLSVLARPWSVTRPELPKHRSAHAPDSAELAPGVHLLDPGLLERLDLIARKFPGKSLSIVSGYRPQSRGSLHQSGRAIDLRVAAVGNEELVAFCRTLVDTGCGFYPNSSFVHVDVRNAGSGSVTWIDASGPGESPRYVGEWPPKLDAPPVVSPADVIDDEVPGRRADPSAPTFAPPEAANEPPSPRHFGPSLLPPALGDPEAR